MESPEETSVNEPINWERRYTEDMQKKDEELKSYRYRVLGVSELARQLEEKKEQIEVMKQKISRLEITLVRVENRASSLEKKLKSTNVTTDGNKAAHIPGPSKQILDTMLAENNKLKTALNNLTNRGHSGYVTAVKIDQLEGVIEQQRLQIADLKDQLNALITSDVGNSSTVTLQRQIQKLNKSIKMKDEFCSILSSELKKAQDELRVIKGNSKDVQDGSSQSKDSGISSQGNAAEQETSPEVQDWQRRCESLQHQFEEQRQAYRSKEQRLIKLVSDKEELFNRESRVKNEALESCTQLKQQIDQLKQQLCGKVNSANYDAVARENSQLAQQLEVQQREIESLVSDKARLVNEKQRMQETLVGAASVGGGADQSNQFAQLQRELEAVRHEAESVRVERDELKEQNDEYMDNITFLQDRLKQGEADKRTLEARIKNLDLNVRDLNGQLIRMGVSRNNNIIPRSYHDNFVTRHPMYMQAEVVRDSDTREKQSSQSDPFNSHCGQNVVDTVRRPVGVSRAPPNNPRMMPSHTNPHGMTTPVRVDQWQLHPGHFPASHNQGAGMQYNPAPHQQGNPSFMSLPPQYRGHRGYPDQYPPPRSPDAN